LLNVLSKTGITVVIIAPDGIKPLTTTGPVPLAKLPCPLFVPSPITFKIAVQTCVIALTGGMPLTNLYSLLK